MKRTQRRTRFSQRKSIAALLTGVALAALLVSPAIMIASLAPAMAQTQSAVSVDFRTALEPYGAWRTSKRWGEVWTPAKIARDWRPYTVGHWVYSDDYGWYWVAGNTEADWGWVAYHYGRWVADEELGWAWIPGNDWAPAWVDWRQGDNYVGWAPLPPDELIVAYDGDPNYWSFVRPRDLIAPSVAAVFLPLVQRDAFMHRTRVVNRTVMMRDRHFAVNPGIAPGHIAAAYGRPIRTYDVRPRVFAGTANLPGAIQVRAADLRRGGHDRTARETVTVRGTGEIKPVRNTPAPTAIGHNEPGRLGDHPPRAARGAVQGTVGTAPNLSPEPRRGPAGQENRVTPQKPAARAPPPQAPAARAPARAPQVPAARAPVQQAPAARAPARAPQTPAARAPVQQAPVVRAPAPQAPAARAPSPPPQAPAARAPAPQAPAAQAPRQAPTTSGAAPRSSGGPHEERK
jgi:Family of unknown function (DUF6600)